MKIYLVQHGEALPKEENPQRPLSRKGVDDIEKLAILCSSNRLNIKTIWHSTKLRAKQTAEIIAQQTGAKTQEKAGLSPLDPVRPILEEINNTTEDITIVGHLPFLERLVSFLITGTEDTVPIKFQQGGMVCLEKTENNRWSILWTIFPDQPKL